MVYIWFIYGLYVCSTLFKILKEFEKAESHLMEYFKCIRYQALERSESFPEHVNSTFPVAPADLCCAYAVLSLVLEQVIS